MAVNTIDKLQFLSFINIITGFYFVSYLLVKSKICAKLRASWKRTFKIECPFPFFSSFLNFGINAFFVRGCFKCGFLPYCRCRKSLPSILFFSE